MEPVNFAKMHFRDWKSRMVHRTTVTVSSTCMMRDLISKEWFSIWVSLVAQVSTLASHLVLRIVVLYRDKKIK